jgi:capsule polysaccharide export protein KpsC/LpsZ
MTFGFQARDLALSSLDFCLRIGRWRFPAVGISSAAWLNETNKFLPDLLNAKVLIVPKDDRLAGECSGFVQWGIVESESKARLREYARSLNRPLAFIEDGFIRSLGLGLSQEPGRSIIMDDLAFYYDARKPSRIEAFLNSTWKIGLLKRSRARRAIQLIVRERISKYNDAPEVLPELLTKDRRRQSILVIDQRAGDASIAGALASEASFKAMVDAAFRVADADVVVKIHPDAFMPGKFSAVSSALAAYRGNPRLKIISEPVNPYVLFEAVDQVFVVASGMGFEALMAQKPVTCFGVPYYSGWGLTKDMVDVPRRTRSRTVEEIFHIAWIALSRYVDPNTRRLVTLEQAVRTLAKERDARGLVAGSR